MKKPVQILIVTIAALVGLTFAKNLIAQTVLTGAMSAASHVPVRIGGVNLSFLSASIRIKNLEVSNPSGFPDRRMLSIPQIFIDFEPSELFKGRAHFKMVQLDLKEMIVEKNNKGQLNVDAVKPTEKQKSEAKQKAKTPEGGKPPKLLIDTLSISIGKVLYKDFSQGGSPMVETFDINIQNREYHNIDNPSAVVSLVMFEALTRTSLSRLANLDLDSFKQGGIQALSKGLGVVTDGTDAVQNTTKQLLNLIK